jgi:glycosyltransferase involved in cell wall biosynthesis
MAIVGIPFVVWATAFATPYSVPERERRTGADLVPQQAGPAPRLRDPDLISVVVPVYNAAETLHPFHDRLSAALPEYAFEVIYVDDGSRDDTRSLLEELVAADSRARMLRLAGSFGYEPALTAGLDHARGQAVVMLDTNLSDTPTILRALIHEWASGADFVYGLPAAVTKDDSPPRWAVLLRNQLTSHALESTLTFPGGSTSVRLVDRGALQSLPTVRDRRRYILGMSRLAGYDQRIISYTPDLHRPLGAYASFARGIGAFLAAVDYFPRLLIGFMVFGSLLGAFGLLGVVIVLVSSAWNLSDAAKALAGTATLLGVAVSLWLSASVTRYAWELRWRERSDQAVYEMAETAEAGGHDVTGEEPPSRESTPADR